MHQYFQDLRQTLAPGRESAYGPLPPLLVAMTLVTGLVDAFSYLVLGHVFVANMTGNVVLLGFALVGTKGFSIAASALAIASFGLGALLGGRVGSLLSSHRGRHLSTAAVMQCAFLAIAVAFAALAGLPVHSGYRYALIVALAAAMGVQNSTARKLAVPELTTTVLTLTITGIAADSTIAGGSGSKSGRRLVAVAAMLAGAVIGAAFVVAGHSVYPLVVALVVASAVAAAARVLGASSPTWTRPTS